MYYPIKDGSVEKIYNYDCQLPPVGYGKNVVTGKLEYVGVQSSSTKKSEQKWKCQPILADYEKKRRKEQERQKYDETFIDNELENYRQQQWKHRLCGCWIMIKGKEVYLTNNHWYYLQWIKIDIGAPAYRDNDRKFFYVWGYCEEDPRCGGLVHAARRREGKTFKGGSILLEYVSRNKNVNAGIQSKTSPDAKEVFKKAVVNTFKKMPDFFRPVFDQSKGITPTTELRFAHTTIKGRRALDNLDKLSLDSYIDFKSSDVFAYDGTKQTRHFEDEVGKTMEVDVYKRWQVNRFCLDQDGVWCGKGLLSTTVEDMESGGEAFKKLWDASNPNERDKNGRTKSGLYRYFLPAQETTFFDEYGMAEVDKAVEYYHNQRDGLRDDPRALSSIIRKNPMSEADMFRIDGETCLYDSMKLNDRRDELVVEKDITEQGNFEWVEKDKEVRWVKSQNGRWRLCRGFQFDIPEHLNNVIIRPSYYRPANVFRYVCAIDPYDHAITQDDERRSLAASYVKKKHNPMRGDDPFDNAYICEYCARPESPDLMYEDMIKQCFYFGCEILVENNKPGIIKYFKARGYEAFLIRIPGVKEVGIAASTKTTQTICELTENYIFTNINKVYHVKLIEDWLEFNPEKTTKFDRAMAWGYTELADTYKLMKKQSGVLTDIHTFFKLHKFNS